MITRVILTLIFTISAISQVWACDCAPWEGYVSEFTENYVSVWAVPTDAAVNMKRLGTPSGGVTYELHILESYGRVGQTDINVNSSVAGGGSCGVELTLGIPQFISAYDYGDGYYAVSSCTPIIPYDAINHYLETGEDSFIPKWSKCHSWLEGEYETPVFNNELKTCSIWKDADHIRGYIGTKDRRKYDKIWWDRVEAINAKTKKKRRWWHFKKD